MCLSWEESFLPYPLGLEDRGQIWADGHGGLSGEEAKGNAGLLADCKSSLGPWRRLHRDRRDCGSKARVDWYCLPVMNAGTEIRAGHAWAELMCKKWLLERSLAPTYEAESHGCSGGTRRRAAYSALPYLRRSTQVWESGLGFFSPLIELRGFSVQKYRKAKSTNLFKAKSSSYFIVNT